MVTLPTGLMDPDAEVNISSAFMAAAARTGPIFTL
jgi:hypothetical protein